MDNYEGEEMTEVQEREEYYCKSVTELTDGRFNPLRELKGPSSYSQSKGVYGVIKAVRAEAMFTRAASKTIQVVDPSSPDSGVDIRIDGRSETLVVGNIIKISQVSDGNNRGEYTCLSLNVKQFKTFTHDYTLPFDERIHPRDYDKKICQLLEEWYSDVLMSFDISKLRESGLKYYVDLACQVLRTRIMMKSVAVSIWDGSRPSIEIEDPWRQEYADFYYPKDDERFISRCNDDYFVEAQEGIVEVNVWKSERKGESHFDTCAQLTLNNGDDLLVIFNIEVCRSYPDLTRHIPEDSMALTLRSGNHQGKGVRQVRRESVLGRKLMTKIHAVAKIPDVIRVPNSDGGEDVYVDSVEKVLPPKPPRLPLVPPSASRSSPVKSTSSQVSPKKAMIEEVSSSPFRQPKKVRNDTSIGVRTEVSVDLSDPETQDLLNRMPKQHNFEVMCQMKLDDMYRYRDMIESSDDGIICDEWQLGPHFSKEDLIQVINLAITKKRAEEINLRYNRSQ